MAKEGREGQKSKQRKNPLLIWIYLHTATNPASQCSYFFSQLWLPTVQEVLHADWQEVWHSPQPPFFTVVCKFFVFNVRICSMAPPPLRYDGGQACPPSRQRGEEGPTQGNSTIRQYSITCPDFKYFFSASQRSPKGAQGAIGRGS